MRGEELEMSEGVQAEGCLGPKLEEPARPEPPTSAKLGQERAILASLGSFAQAAKEFRCSTHSGLGSRQQLANLQLATCLHIHGESW